ncbi:MAG TPA: type II toxin-antitoxin system PemK/MazF family toxin [Saprospiraceae bacterium]|nr:type II toxin-antitoxin system PemK/MazF family toxin [Saprospiraceae bacterium]
MNQSEIWLIDLEPTKGSEINKKRPAIIVNVDGLGKLPLKVIIPITEWKDRYEIAPLINYNYLLYKIESTQKSLHG